jgi:hypothetical protein
MFEVTDIVENRDANISSNCMYDPSKAFFILSVAEVKKDGVFLNIDNSVNRLV